MGFSFPFPMQSPSRWDLHHLAENLQAVCTSYAKLNKPNATAYSTRRNSELLNLQLETKVPHANKQSAERQVPKWSLPHRRPQVLGGTRHGTSTCWCYGAPFCGADQLCLNTWHNNRWQCGDHLAETTWLYSGTWLASIIREEKHKKSTNPGFYCLKLLSHAYCRTAISKLETGARGRGQDGFRATFLAMARPGAAAARPWQPPVTGNAITLINESIT